MDVAIKSARIAMLMGEPARAAMLWSLLDGQSRPATELAFCANVSAQNASAHLSRLLKSGLIVATNQGRHRYFKLANSEVAQVVEALATLGQAPNAREVPPPGQGSSFRLARTCYDHLAGKVAVDLYHFFSEQNYIRQNEHIFTVTQAGSEWLQDFGIDVAAYRTSRRPLLRRCLDLSERQSHLAGALGASLMDQLLLRKWIQKDPGTRLVKLTNLGISELKNHFGLYY